MSERPITDDDLKRLWASITELAPGKNVVVGRSIVGNPPLPSGVDVTRGVCVSCSGGTWLSSEWTRHYDALSMHVVCDKCVNDAAERVIR